MSEIKNRYDFIFMFDVKDGNPNGDPDAGNLPRADPETGQGLVSDVCIKRKVRNFVMTSRGGSPGYDVFVKEKAVLNEAIDAVYSELGIAAEGGKKAKDNRGGKDDVDKARKRMCEKYFDVRTFGAVMSSGRNAGQVRGPAQVTFSRSIDRVFSQEHSITRMAVATAEEAENQKGDNRTMGRKMTIPYGLYVGQGFVSPMLAKQTGFTEADLGVLWEAFAKMFELDRSAAHGLMSLQRLLAFRHDSELGNAPAHRLFDLIDVKRKAAVEVPRTFKDYEVSIGKPPTGITVMELNDGGNLQAR